MSTGRREEEREGYAEAQEKFAGRVGRAGLVPAAGTKREVYMNGGGHMRRYAEEIRRQI